MSGKKKKTSEQINTNDVENSVVSSEEEDIDAALSASLDGLYENDFIQEVEPSEETSENVAETFENNTEQIEDENSGFSEEVGELIDFPNEKIEKDSSTEFTEEDAALIDDISEALAVQIKSDLKKHSAKKKRGRSFWWLLTLIPFLGVLVLFFKRLRRDMPKILMLLRVLIFVSFTLLFVGSVATKGSLDYFLISRWASNEMTLVEYKSTVLIPSPTPEISGLHEEKQIVNSLVSIKDSKTGSVSQVVVSFDEKKGNVEFFPVLKPVNAKPLEIRRTFEEKYLVGLDGIFIVDSEGFIKFIDRLGGIELSISKSELSDLKLLFPKDTKKLENGVCVLSGKLVNAYMQMLGRTLDTPDGPESAVIRQKRVYESIAKKIQSNNIFVSFYAANASVKKTSTDIKPKDLFNYLNRFGNCENKTFKQEIFYNNSSASDLRVLVFGTDFND